MGKRRLFIGGNWKMHGDRASATALARDVAAGCARDVEADVETAIFPAFVHLDPIATILANAPAPPLLGAQDAFHEPQGAYTGEISVPMLADLGVQAVLTGHSERRHVLGEPDELVAKKTRAVLDGGLLCVLCVGETLEEREQGLTDAVNERQLRAALEGVAPAQAERLVVAYEPVWAIGTGRTASPEDAQRAHAHLRAILCELFGQQAAQRIRVIYGGSVKPGNAAALLAQEDVDGALVGGASLVAEDFLAIRQAAAQRTQET